MQVFFVIFIFFLFPGRICFRSDNRASRIRGTGCCACGICCAIRTFVGDFCWYPFNNEIFSTKPLYYMKELLPLQTKGNQWLRSSVE